MAKSGGSDDGKRGRAVVVANRIPFPLDDGWKVRAFRVLEAVVASHEETTLFTFRDEGHPIAAEGVVDAVAGRLGVQAVAPPARNGAWRLARGFVSSTPLYVLNNHSSELQARLDAHLAAGPAELGVAVCTFMAPYFHSRPIRPHRVVIDTHNLDSELMQQYAVRLPSWWHRLYAQRAASQLRSLEAREFERADEVWVCSRDEVRRAEALAPGAVVRCVPNGVDVGAFASTGRQQVPGRLLFFGKLDYAPNVDAIAHFLASTWPDLRARDPGAELHVVGRSPAPEVVRACRGVEGVTLVGELADIRPELEEAEVIIVPLRMGGGTRLKILEAMAAGRAIVSTRIGAEGIEAVDGDHIILADAPREFAEAVGVLLRDRVKRDRLGARAQALATERYDWASIQGNMPGL